MSNKINGKTPLDGIILRIKEESRYQEVILEELNKQTERFFSRIKEEKIRVSSFDLTVRTENDNCISALIYNVKISPVFTLGKEHEQITIYRQDEEITGRDKLDLLDYLFGEQGERF